MTDDPESTPAPAKPIFSVLLAHTMLVSVVPVALVIVLGLLIYRSTLLAQGEQALQVHATAHAARLEALWSTITSIEQLISSRTQLRVSLAEETDPATGPDRRLRIQRIIDDARRATPALLGVRIFDVQEGLVAESGRLLAGDILPLPLADDDPLQDHLVLDGDGGLVFRFQGPLTLEDRVIGSFSLDVDGMALVASLFDHAVLGETGRAILMLDDGSVTGADTRAAALQFHPAASRVERLSPADPFVAEILRVRESMRLDQATSGNLQSAEHLMALAAPQAGLTLVVLRHRGELLLPLTDLIPWLLVGGSLLAIAMGWASWRLARRFAGPIEALERAAVALNAGAPASIRQYSGLAEVNAVSEAINRLVQGLIDERRRLAAANERLRQQEEHIRTTLRSIGDAVIATDPSGAITEMNPVAEQLTGWTLAEARGRPLEEVFHILSAIDRQPLANPVSKVLATDGIVDLSNHTVLVSRNQQEYQIADCGAPIRSDSAQTIGVVLVFRDMTQEYVLREQLNQNQKMEAVGQLAGGIAHDFNNMLGGIMAAADLLTQYLRPSAKADEIHGMLMASTERAAELTHKLLSFTRSSHHHEQQIDLHTVLDEMLSVLVRTLNRNIRIDLRKGVERAMVRGSASELISVFLNLGINASHAMPQGGTIIIATERITLDLAHCANTAFDLTPGEHVAVEFTDSGCGIPAEQLSRVFDPFFTTKEIGKGTGLGLTSAYGIVKNHRGAITVYSEMGRGTTFRIWLPLIPAPDESRTPSDRVLIRGTGTILVVDDEPVMRATATMILEELGYTVLQASHGEEALANHRQQRGDIDLVLLDMIMPVMSGPDCFRALRAAEPDLPVLVTSGFSHKEEIERLEAEGLAGFIAKPFRSADLSAMVAACLAKRSARHRSI